MSCQIARRAMKLLASQSEGRDTQRLWKSVLHLDRKVLVWWHKNALWSTRRGGVLLSGCAYLGLNRSLAKPMPTSGTLPTVLLHFSLCMFTQQELLRIKRQRPSITNDWSTVTTQKYSETADSIAWRRWTFTRLSRRTDSQHVPR